MPPFHRETVVTNSSTLPTRIYKCKKKQKKRTHSPSPALQSICKINLLIVIDTQQESPRSVTTTTGKKRCVCGTAYSKKERKKKTCPSQKKKTRLSSTSRTYPKLSHMNPMKLGRCRAIPAPAPPPSSPIKEQMKETSLSTRTIISHHRLTSLATPPPKP